jgi:hypothetical protein
VRFLQEHTAKALQARGVDGRFSGENPQLTIVLQQFRMRNYRASGLHPSVTATTLRVEPCYNIPLSLVVKAYASTVRRMVLNYQAPDTKVQQLADSMTTQYHPTSSLEVFTWGFTNNPKAIPVIVQRTTHASEVVRWAAIASLGTLNAVEHLAYLQEIVPAPTRRPVEKGYALKSIGDLGTPAARAFLQKTLLRLEAETSHIEQSLTRDIVELYF